MSARNRHGIGTAQKSALSDNEEESGEPAKPDVRGNKGNLKKDPQLPPKNNKQENRTPSTDDNAKPKITAEKVENNNPAKESSKQGQWPGYLTFYLYPVLIGFVIVLLYHVVYVRQLSTIINENMNSIIKRNLEEHYGPIINQLMEKKVNQFGSSFLEPLELKITNTVEKVENYGPIINQLMEKEVNQFRSSFLKPLELNITNTVEKVEHLDTEAQKVEGLITNLSSQQEYIKNDLEGAQNNIETVQANIKQVNSSVEELKNSQKQLDEKNSANEGQSTAIDNKLKQLTADHDLQKQKFDSLREHINNTKFHLDEQLATVETKVTNLKSSVSALDSRFNQTQNLTDVVDSLQSKYEEKIEPNLFNKGQFVIAFMILFVLVLILMVSHYRLYQRIENAEQGNWFQNKPKRFQSSTDILRQVPSKPQLQAAVCIISFDEGRQAAHQQLLDSANLPNCRVVTFVVGRHANIPDLPRCKVYLMCTEFSERHVIIEEQGLGLGDLHRTTYDAVLKLGGQLIILYTRDPGSRRLKDDEVFNKNIYCVTHQEELVELNNLGRFFSVYDTLTAQQKTKLRKTIMDCLQ